MQEENDDCSGAVVFPLHSLKIEPLPYEMAGNY